jgi:predicted metal-dependent hydrolase
VSNKHERIAALAAAFEGHGVDPRYAGYFLLFNQQKYYEAHDVLEDLWLPARRAENGNYYKALIQLAGAFVHLQKNRLRPAAALFKLAHANLETYPDIHERLNLAAVRLLIFGWQTQLERNEFIKNPLTPSNVPQLALQKSLLAE